MVDLLFNVEPSSPESKGSPRTITDSLNKEGLLASVHGALCATLDDGQAKDCGRIRDQRPAAGKPSKESEDGGQL